MVVVENSNIVYGFGHANGFGEQSLSKIAIHKALVSLHSAASVTSTPSILGIKMTVTWTSGYDINEATPFVEVLREKRPWKVLLEH
ncbi:unnamed protein product [Trifolium pratense]|uniref:Uncharacterized protein n=1 Tax=Trifolium pratense TaxID=57577 RepID=A0ACB0L4H4_TRIPR|nr:unnamed protein product [Trifolium pratense]